MLENNICEEKEDNVGDVFLQYTKSVYLDIDDRFDHFCHRQSLFTSHRVPPFDTCRQNSKMSPT